jgi:EAL domain-containing protein (putative c-di-GMP-specific phosphodiesterase class I)
MVAEYSDQLPDVKININLPPYILKDPDSLTNLVEYIKELNIDPETICFEITEDEDINADELIPQVKFLTDNNFTIAMDDFGTGYSSLERLSLIAFDTVKIDRSLLLSASNSNKTILENSISLIKRLGESVVVEGVETLEQLSLIKKLGADSVQGFLLSKPVPIVKINDIPKNISEVVGAY